ncbi:hypothetical protein HY732_00395 [Candidatus Uhrbacteria bacterium]|nr:hypothetical protein [Candidatus Uhrbacteria bacterium]
MEQKVLPPIRLHGQDVEGYFYPCLGENGAAICWKQSSMSGKGKTGFSVKTPVVVI